MTKTGRPRRYHAVGRLCPQVRGGAARRLPRPEVRVHEWTYIHAFGYTLCFAPPPRSRSRNGCSNPHVRTYTRESREALAAELDQHIRNGVAVYMAFHAEPDAPPAFVNSDEATAAAHRRGGGGGGQGQQRGRLVGGWVGPMQMNDADVAPVLLTSSHTKHQTQAGIYAATAIDHMTIPRLPATFPSVSQVCPRRFLSDVKVSFVRESI